MTTQPGATISLVGAAMIAVGVEGSIIVLIIAANEISPLVVAAQLLLSISFAWWGFALFRAGERRLELFLLALSVVALGPLGAAGAIMMILMRKITDRFATPFDQWYASLFPWLEKDKVSELYEMIAWRGVGPASRSTVTPFRDVLTFGTVKQKQAVLTMVSDRFQSEFSPILRLALNDSEPAIRVQAASVVARIENDFLQRSVALKRMQIHGRSDMMLHRELAQYYATYAALGLLDPGRANAAMLEALDHYTIVLRENPKDPTIVEPIARLLLRLDRPDEAFQILKPWLAAGNISSCCAELYTEALFQLGKFADIRKFLQKHEHALRAESFDEQGRAAIGFWAQAARVHA
jgi:hypothetical protein